MFANAFDPSQYEDITSEEDLAQEQTSSEDPFDSSQYENINGEEELPNENTQDSSDSIQDEDIENIDTLSQNQMEEDEKESSQTIQGEEFTQNQPEVTQENDFKLRQGFLFMAGYGIVIIVLALLLLLYSIHYFRKRRGEHHHIK